MGGKIANKLSVKTGRPYEVLIGQDLLSESASYIREYVDVPPKKVFMVTDDKVAPIYAAPVLRSLMEEGYETEPYIFLHGEDQKTMETVSKIVSHMGVHAFDRGDLVVALGGGLVGDVAGFAAAIYSRGIRFVQIPTTLLAMVDSSVGGKTGVNLPAGKNLAGAFWQPSLVLCDTEALKSLPGETFLDGIAEALKTGLIRDASLFYDINNMGADCQSSTEPPLQGEVPPKGTEGLALATIVKRCLEIKSSIVEEDERESGVRALLNFGHTYAHAIENLSKYEISHGHAVAIGMCMAARAAEKTGFAKEPVAAEIEAALEKWGLPTVCPFGAKEMREAMLHDKKRGGEYIKLVLPRKIGLCETEKVELARLAEYL